MASKGEYRGTRENDGGGKLSYMAETLGSLSDKLTIVKLKQYHTEDAERLESLARQEIQLREEIDGFIEAAADGRIPFAKLTFSSNKVYRKDGNETQDFSGTVGEIFGQLADINCKLWHVQEKVYEFEDVPSDSKDAVIKDLAILNLERNKCIDELDRTFAAIVEKASTNG
jgi:hypothetical protein